MNVSNAYVDRMIGAEIMNLRKVQYSLLAGLGIGLAATTIAYLLLSYPQSAGRQNQSLEFQGEMSKFVQFQKPWPAPRTPFLGRDENTTNLSHFRGKVVLLNFWATWCYPCLLEMPSLNSLQAHFGGRRFAVVALSIDQGGLADIERFYRKLKLDRLDYYIDPVDKVGPAFRLRGVPTSFIIDHDGMVRGYFPGPADWNSHDAQAVIRHFVAQITNDIDIVDVTGVTNQPE